ncbi:Teichuronic acid biosynthesis protein TuaB [Rubripirellula amarantea]|uniref:Teichuronic acid biosynthesis protein TuaB n=1 Tax=Rubripirellula amarantea TaxID=2527999 RepID=A0A5C5WXE8_9BACT|nr:lipopolysaccharide biosynthesis protein [Rubripirellula amarantea]TWT54673.1 Teichuronic acid biosynthesis protein TuaB [Rubripirellula amarantea]
MSSAVAQPNSLKDATVAGAAWLGIAMFTDRVARMASSAVLVALLTPQDFGIASVLWAIIAFGKIFANGGTGAAIIQRKELETGIIDSVFVFNMVVGVISSGLLYLASKPLAFWFSTPELEYFLRIVSVVLVFSACAVVPSSLLQRQMRFNVLAAIDIAQTLLSSVAMVVLALLDFGVWSLILPRLILSMLVMIAYMRISNYIGSVRAKLGDIRKIFSYSGYLTLYTFVNYLNRNADVLIIGKFIGMSAAGIYGLAAGFMMLPVQSCGEVIKRVAFPAFSRLQDDKKRFNDAYLDTVSMVAFVTMPVVAGILAVIGVAIDAFFGSEWEATADIFLLLAPAAMIEAVGSTSAMIFQSKGKTGVMFAWQAIGTLVTTIALLTGTHFGPRGVAIAFSIATALVSIPGLLIAFRIASISIASFLTRVTPSILCSMLMGLVAHYSSYLLPSIDLKLIFAIQVLVGIASYVALSYTLNREVLEECISLTEPMRRKAFLPRTEAPVS